MSTIEDFKNAPIGATATNAGGSRAMKTYESEWSWVTPNRGYSSDEGMERLGYTLDRPAPTSAREALDLAWDLAHEVKEGQVILKGTPYLMKDASGLMEHTTLLDNKILPELVPIFRTLEPLSDPKPDWIDAPAVLAWSRWDDVRREKIWSKDDGCYKSTDGEIANWQDLTDVTPLYPKEDA